MNTPTADQLKIYDVTSRETGEKHVSLATNAEEACKLAGWHIGNCFVREQKPTRKALEGQPTQLLYKVPCQPCPYQYTECRMPADKKCPVRLTAPELKDWLKQATEAHICPYQGKALDRKDYLLRQKWATMEETILDLSPQPDTTPPNSSNPPCPALLSIL